MEPSQNTISLKMIPRIDYDRIKARMSLVLWGCAAGGGEGVLDLCWWPSPHPSPSDLCLFSYTERLVCQKEEV